MIQTLKAVNLNRSMNLDLTFHDDINIITGKNGSGKTTLLKLLWYAMSGNLERIVREITFDSFELVTSTLTISMAIEKNEAKPRMLKLRFRYFGGDLNEVVRTLDSSEDLDLGLASYMISRRGTSTYFPTYRRVESGVINPIPTFRDNDAVQPFYDNLKRLVENNQHDDEFRELKQSLNQVSERLSVRGHRFVASISTDDINGLLTSKLAELSGKTNELHTNLSTFVLRKSNAATVAVDDSDNSGLSGNEDAKIALAEIHKRASDISELREQLQKPFTVLSELITKVFDYTGIRFANAITLGGTIGAIASDVLSAGEKQMLSFFCYNAFSSNSCLFIDEPEISLHVDWQRILFPLLLKQSMGNQFIVATHSPFIYSKYADKELVLDPDRGNADADAVDD